MPHDDQIMPAAVQKRSSWWARVRRIGGGAQSPRCAGTASRYFEAGIDAGGAVAAGSAIRPTAARDDRESSTCAWRNARRRDVQFHFNHLWPKPLTSWRSKKPRCGDHSDRWLPHTDVLEERYDLRRFQRDIIAGDVKPGCPRAGLDDGGAIIRPCKAAEVNCRGVARMCE